MNISGCCVFTNRKRPCCEISHMLKILVICSCLVIIRWPLIDAPPSSGQKHVTPCHVFDLFWNFDLHLSLIDIRYFFMPSWIEKKEAAMFGCEGFSKWRAVFWYYTPSKTRFKYLKCWLSLSCLLPWAVKYSGAPHSNDNPFRKNCCYPDLSLCEKKKPIGMH